MTWLVKLLLICVLLTPYYNTVLKGNVYAVSVDKLDSVWWTEYFKPIQIGYSIHIYDFRENKEK